MTKESITEAIEILTGCNRRSKHIRNAAKYLESVRRTAPLADATWETFHNRTGAVWERRSLNCASNGKLLVSRPPDFISPSGSMYWRVERGVYRLSDHWGIRVRNCNWWLRGQDERHTTCEVTALAFCEYRHFVRSRGRRSYRFCAEKRC
jgi:hypothetical protein